jgi:branched-chain amino acid transport system substrate-binding protein
VPPEPDIRIGAGESVTIGVSAALSGTQINLGTDIADATELAVSDHGGMLRGKPIRVVRMDDGCNDPERAVKVAADLLSDHTLIGVIGPMCTTGAQAADSRYEAQHIVHISPSATRLELSAQGEKFFFRTSWRDDVQASTQSLYALAEMQAKTAVVIDDGDPYGTTLADAFVASYEQQGGRVLSRERIKRGTIDFKGLVAQIKSATPDIVVYEGLNPEGALLVKALRQGQYAGGFMGADGLLSVRDFLATAGPDAEGAVITGGGVPDADFVARFTAKSGRPPSTPFVLQAYDAVSALIAAAEADTTSSVEVGTLVIGKQRLADAIRTRKFRGLTGDISFNEAGDRTGTDARSLGLTIYRVVQGVFVPVQ